MRPKRDRENLASNKIHATKPHPIKIGDTVKVLDKDYPFEGEVTDLTYFFVHLKTDSGELITIPNSLLLQKSVSLIENNNTSKKKTE